MPTWKCTQNFIILNQVVAEKTLMKNVPMCYIGVTEGKNEHWKKKAKWGLASKCSFTQSTLPAWRCTQNLKTLAPIGAEKSVTEIFIGEKEKWTNNGTDKKYEAVLFLLHNTTDHYQALYQISES